MRLADNDLEKGPGNWSSPMTWNRKLDSTHTGQDAVKLCSVLRNEAVGRDEAIDQIMNLYQTDLAGPNSRQQPVGNFSFVGPTGSGRSSLATAAVESTVGGARAAANIDRGELQHGYETAKRIGIPSTQIEHPETRPLISRSILTKCHADIIKPGFALFSGLRRASDALHNLLFDVLDKVTLTLGAKIGTWISLTP
jgi:ATP-dependent Clp protease ATP-binding subunit ClpA